MKKLTRSRRGPETLTPLPSTELPVFGGSPTLPLPPPRAVAGPDPLPWQPVADPDPTPWVVTPVTVGF